MSVLAYAVSVMAALGLLLSRKGRVAETESESASELFNWCPEKLVPELIEENGVNMLTEQLAWAHMATGTSEHWQWETATIGMEQTVSADGVDEITGLPEPNPGLAGQGMSDDLCLVRDGRLQLQSWARSGWTRADIERELSSLGYNSLRQVHRLSVPVQGVKEAQGPESSLQPLKCNYGAPLPGEPSTTPAPAR